MRELMMAVHRYSGLVLLLFLGIAALTGCVLSFERPLDAWLNPGLFRPIAPGSIDPLIAVERLQRRYPKIVATRLPLRAMPGRNIPVAVAARSGAPLGFDQVVLDGGDGHVTGVRQLRPGWRAPGLMQGVYQFHYTLLAGTIGRWLMALAAFAWLVSNLIGVYLTWPARPPYWRTWKRSWTFRRSSPLPRLLLDVHRLSGLWLLPPLTVLAFTSLAMNLFSEAWMPVVQRLSPATPSPFDGPATAHPAPIRLALGDALARARADAARDGIGWRAAVIDQAADRALIGVSFTRSGVEEYRGLGPVTYWLDGGDGHLAYVDNPYADSAGRKLSRALYPLHTGQMIGPAGVALDDVLGLATLEMMGTGVYLWLKRRPGRVARRRRGRAAQARP